MRGRFLSALFALLCCLCIASAESIHVAVSMCDVSSAREIALTQSILNCLDSASLSVCMLDAGGRLSQQVSDVNALIAEEPEYLIVSSAKSLGLGETIHRAAEAGIRVIQVDQFAMDALPDDICAQIGVDWLWAAQACVEALSDRSDAESLSILEITGTAGTSATNELSGSFRRALRSVENAHIAGVLDGGKDRQTAKQAMTQFIEKKGLCFNAVFAHGDEQALGAINALMNLPGTDAIRVVCVGGMDDALRALQAGSLYACAAPELDYGAAILGIINSDDASPDVSFRGSLLFAADVEGQ